MTAEMHPVEREELMAYLDGELAADAAARVAAHLTACADCRQLEADLRSVSAQMLIWNVEPAPPQINEGVLAALHANPSQNSAEEPSNFFRFAFQHRIRIARWALAAACLGVVAMILVRVLVLVPSKEVDLAQLVTSRISRPAGDQKGSVSPAPS